MDSACCQKKIGVTTSNSWNYASCSNGFNCLESGNKRSLYNWVKEGDQTCVRSISTTWHNIFKT